MDVSSQTLIYFSPTRTTERILSAVADGTGIGLTERCNLTPPEATKNTIRVIGSELALIGAPVYGGRIALEAVNRLGRIRGNNTPAVLIAVYGNREYEDALVELRDIAGARGFVPVAAAAFIGEHSFASAAIPIAYGRPDEEDIKIARDFGGCVRKKLEKLAAPPAQAPFPVPGNSPYKERKARGGVSPVTMDGTCSLCGTCADLCPMAAISVSQRVITNKDLCIICCACVKNCPTGARVMQDPDIDKAANWLYTNYGTRKEPQTYL